MIASLLIVVLLLVIIRNSDLLFHSNIIHMSNLRICLQLAKGYPFSHSNSPSRCSINIIAQSQFVNNKRKSFVILNHSFSRLYSTRREGLGKPKGYAGHQQQYKLEIQNLSGLPKDIDTKPFIVLGIESSCDDTGVAIVRSDGVVLANVLYSQYDIHSRFGGVVPGLAMEAHKLNIDKAIDEALVKAGLNSVNDVDAIAVTKGPGLEICLRIGTLVNNICMISLILSCNQCYMCIH
jgi:tRNA N6-adenosine threonylcarbamoyltransferase